MPQWTAAQQEYLAVRQLGDAALTRAAPERLALQFIPVEVIRLLERSGKPQNKHNNRNPPAGFVFLLNKSEAAQANGAVYISVVALSFKNGGGGGGGGG
ncbi:efflux RND transporter periplasmic adaptor subunit, partial [Enterobacter intestinihominis]